MEIHVSRRRALVTSITGIAGMSVAKVNAGPQLVSRRSDWDTSAFDLLLKKPAHVKQAYDITAIGDGKFLNNIKNSLNGLHFGFAIPVNQIQVVAALHGPANLLNYDDYIWQRYKIGDWLKVEDPRTGRPAIRNIFYASPAGGTGKELRFASDKPDDEDSPYQDKSIQGLQARGVQFLSCHTATEEQARVLIKRLNLTEKPEEIVRDMLAHTLPGVLVVASMVAAVALLQIDGHYSYITV